MVQPSPLPAQQGVRLDRPVSHTLERSKNGRREVHINKHTLRLLGGPANELRVSATTLQEVLSVLIEGARQATRFQIEGESVRKGPRPAWLDAVSSLEITGLTQGSAVLALDAPTLGEAVPQYVGHGQHSLFEQDEERLASCSAIDLFGEVLAQVLTDDSQNVLADRALLDTCARFAMTAIHPFTGVQLEGLTGRGEPIVVRPADVPKIERLRDETPSPQGTRVMGILDTISASRADVILRLDDGTKVPSRLEQHDLARLRALFGKPVVVSGTAHFRPSGQLLLVDVESITEARAQDSLFAHLPRPRARSMVAAAVPQDETSGVAAFFGTWPGEQTDSQLLEALQAIE